MNEEADKKDIISDNSTSPVPIPPKNANTAPFSVFAVIIAVVAIVLIGGLYFYSSRSKTGEQPIISEQKQEQKQIGILDDLIFLKGFQNTGREWPPKETDRLAEHQQNPLTRLRQAYCERVGYKYADFGGDCFVYQYFDSYKTYNDNEAKFTVYYPTFWQADLEPLNYGFTADPKVSLKRQGASCNIVYGLVDENRILSFANASTSKMSFGNQASGGVVSDIKGLNKITLPFDRQLSNEEKAAGYTSSKLIAVPHFPYASSPFGFLMTSGDKQPLVEACVQEFDSILNGRSINYSPAKLSNQSSGILSIQDVSSWFESYAHIPQKITLLFDNSATGKEESIVPEAFSGLQRISDPFLSGGKLFYTEGSGDNPIIKTIDILTGENKTIPLTYDATKPIHSFFVRGDILYYLSGTFCNEYLAKCKDLNLKSYNIKSGISENLASGITARDIDGFNVAGDALILRWSDGDGGCGWGSYQSFTLSTKALKDLGSYSYCEGDAGDSYTKFKNLVAGSGSFNYLVVKNGKIFSPSGIDTYPRRIYIRVNTTEYPKDQ